MTTEEEIKAIEKDIRTILKKKFIPSLLVTKANVLIERWKVLTGWKEDTTPVLYEEKLIDKTPYYQSDETRKHKESSNLS